MNFECAECGEEATLGLCHLADGREVPLCHACADRLSVCPECCRQDEEMVSDVCAACLWRTHPGRQLP